MKPKTETKHTPGPVAIIHNPSYPCSCSIDIRAGKFGNHVVSINYCAIHESATALPATKKILLIGDLDGLGKNMMRQIRSIGPDADRTESLMRGCGYIVRRVAYIPNPGCDCDWRYGGWNGKLPKQGEGIA